MALSVLTPDLVLAGLAILVELDELEDALHARRPLHVHPSTDFFAADADQLRTLCWSGGRDGER